MSSSSSSGANKPLRVVFIGNIPYDCTEEQLLSIFNTVGPVASLRLVFDRETGKPKGYGFCEYFDTETARSCIRNLTNYEVNGRNLRLDFADSMLGAPKDQRKENKAARLMSRSDSHPSAANSSEWMPEDDQMLQSSYESHHVPMVPQHHHHLNQQPFLHYHHSQGHVPPPPIMNQQSAYGGGNQLPPSHHPQQVHPSSVHHPHEYLGQSSSVAPSLYPPHMYTGYDHPPPSSVIDNPQDMMVPQFHHQHPSQSFSIPQQPSHPQGISAPLPPSHPYGQQQPPSQPNLSGSQFQPPTQPPPHSMLPPNPSTEAVVMAVDSLPPAQLLSLLSQTKSLIQSQPAQARAMLSQNPQLTFAIFHSLWKMDLIDAATIQRTIASISSQQQQNQPAKRPLSEPSQAEVALSKDPRLVAPSKAHPRPTAGVPAGSLPSLSTTTSSPDGANSQRQLLAQIMSMTPDQIEALPLEQKEKVLLLKKKFQAK